MDKTCFVIGPIGDEGSETRRHADWVLDGIVNPALVRAGLPHAVRADKIATPGMIDSQVISKVLDADLVIADLTTRNPNAFYELGLRHMAEKPIVHLIHKSETKLIPFDVAPYRTVFVSWDTPTEMEQSIEQLQKHVQAAISPEHDVENPVTKARGRQHLKATASSAEKVLLEELQGLSSRVAALENTKSVSITGVNWFPRNAVVSDHGDRVGGNYIPIVNMNRFLTFDNVRNLNGKPASLADTTDRDGKVIAVVEGEQVRMTKEEWEKLPLWAGLLP